MDNLYITKQKIFNNKKELYAYELSFTNSDNEETKLSNSVSSTSKLIISSITSTKLNDLLGNKAYAFVNVDESTLKRGILDVLDKNRFVLNISENIELSEEIIQKIVQYKKRGFKLSLEHFDSSSAMIIKFKRLFNYIDIIKMDVIASEFENLQKVVKKFKPTRIKLLAQNIETLGDYRLYRDMGFDYFQGYFLDKPTTIKVEASKEPTQFIIMQLIKIIKEETNDATKLEMFIKKQPDLSYKLIQFFNNTKQLSTKVESLSQVITLMGREKLLRWLVVYLYSEVSTNPASKTILDLAIKRAKRMESEALPDLKDKAYLAGMFSMLSSIFDTNINELMKSVDMDKDITSLVLHKRGIFSASLKRAEKAEKDYLRKVMLANFEKLSTPDIIYTLEDGGIEIDENQF